MAQLADYESDHHRREVEGKFLEVANSGDLPRLNKIANSLPLQMIGVNTIHKALLLAALNGHAKVVEFLLAYTIISPKYKISLMGSRSVHASPFFAAVKEGHLEVVRALVNHILPAYKFNPIFAASILPCDEINAEADQQWLQGLVQWAVRWGHVSIVVFLIDKYQKLFNPQLVDVMALTLHLAAYHNHVDVLKVILESKCPETAHQFMLDESWPFMSDNLCKNIATSLFSKDGLTALHLSAQTGCLPAVDMLITKLDDMTVVSDPELFTPLHLAANFGHVQVVKFMLDRCITAASSLGGERAGVHDVILAKDCLGRTALHYAAREGHAEVVRQLVCAAGLAGRTNIACIADYDGLLALHMAARAGHVEVIQILKAFGGIGTTVKHSMEVKTWVEREYYMEQQGRSMDHPSSQLDFCLGKEWKFPRMKFFDALFWRTDGFSPLHFAARYGHIEALQELLKETVIAEDDQNPLFLADRGGFLAYDWMQVQGRGENFLACVAPGWGSPLNVPDPSEVGKFQYLREELVKRSFSQKNMQRAGGSIEQEIRADIAEERTAMHELRRGWQNSGHRIGHIPMQVLQGLVEDEGVDYPSWQGHASTRLMTPPHFGAALIQALGKANFLAAKEILCLPGADFTLDAKNIGNRLKEALRGIKVSAPHEIMNSHESSTLRFLEEFLIVLVTRKEMMGCARWLARWARKNHLDSLLELILGQPEVRRRLFEDRQPYVDCANVLLVGAALIAGVAFQGWLQPPLGFSNEYEGIGYAYVHERARRAFWWMNNGAFFCSVAALIAGATGAVPVTVSTDNLRAWEKVTRAVGIASFFLSMALICVMGAFSAAGFAAVPPFASDVDTIMKITVPWGTIVCGFLLLWFAVGVSPLVILAIRFVVRVLIFALSHSDSYTTTPAQDQQRHGPLDAAKRIAVTLSRKLVRHLRAVVEFEPSHSSRD